MTSVTGLTGVSKLEERILSSKELWTDVVGSSGKETPTVADSLPSGHLAHPSLHAATVGISDPIGCRAAILRYGEILGYPTLHVGPLDLRGGEKNWCIAVNAAAPLWLGVAWQKIEELETERQADLAEAISEQAEKDTAMAVLAWREQKSLDAGYYPAIITELEEVEGQYGSQIQMQFVVLDAEGEQTDEQIRGWCGLSWGEKSKLYAWSKAILGKRCPKPGETMDTDRLKGRKCDIQVEVKPGQEPGNSRAKIVGVMPFDTVSRRSTASDDDDDEKDLPF